MDNSAVHVKLEERLPKEITPLSYAVYIEPNIETKDFNGAIQIHLKWILDSKKIFFHAHSDLDINENQITLKMINKRNRTLSDNVSILRGSRVPRKSIFVLYLKEIVKKGFQCILELAFKGNILETPQGVFMGYYRNSSTQEKEKYLISNLKPNNARHLFPCFDEPGTKVPFVVSICRPKEYKTVFNTRLVKTIQHPLVKDNSLDFFGKTPPISTYTFCFVICKLQVWEKATPDDDALNTINIWSNKLDSNLLENIYKRMEIIYNYLNDFFNISLPLSKIDVVTIPDLPQIQYISSWGILCVRESELTKEGLFSIIKELIYHWVGIWITPSWWSEEILNKAIISFIASEIVIDINGGSEFNGKYPMTILYSLYYELSKRYPHSRIIGMKHEFNAFKTELTIRMIKSIIGKISFKNAIRHLINDYKYKPYDGIDFWRTLSKQAIYDKRIESDLNILSIAESWINKTRLPVIKITRDYKSGTATIVQKVYLRERPHDVPDKEQMLWWIPIALTRQDNIQFSNYSYVWMKMSKVILIDNMPSKNNFIIANPEEIGPFPVNYDNENWHMLSIYLQTDIGREVIPIYTRAKLLHDAWNLAFAGDLSFSAALNMTLFLRKERNHVVWNPVFTFIDQVGKRIENPSIRKKFDLYTLALLTPLYEDLGSENSNDDSWKSDWRKLTKQFLCRAGYLPCVHEAQNVFATWLSSKNASFNNPLPREFMCPVFKWGSMEEWMLGFKLIDQLSKYHLQSDRVFLVKMLAGCPSQFEKIHYLLEITMINNSSTLTETDLILIINMMSTEPAGYTTLLHFISENWTFLHKRFYNNKHVWDRLISCATGMISSQEGYELAKSLYDNNQGQFGSAKHIIERSLRNIKEEVIWSQQNMPVLNEWLERFLA
ncbi:hypothetical protein KR018_005007 [Drosophila ironensis]|nr:hypothetical protein KR018_005007 [Drosophila ironensis]